MVVHVRAPAGLDPLRRALRLELRNGDPAEYVRFCNAMIAIHSEAEDVGFGKSDPDNNLLKRSPHTLDAVTSDTWDRPYSRNQAAFPLEGQRQRKFWPAVARINNAFGDRNLICSCIISEELIEE